MNVLNPNGVRPEPRNHSQIMSAWQRFLSGEDVPQDAIRHLIQDSWNRCLVEGVDPFRDRAPINLGDDGFHAVQDSARELIAASKPVMADAEAFLSESDTVMLVTDPSGLVLHMAGDPAAVASGEEVLLSKGASWSESSVGTNAIGTALSVGKPIQIHAAEHFCKGIKEWTCSATVIRDPHDNEVLGAIDISGLSSTFNQHSLALVVAAASRIEGRLLRGGLETRYRLLDTVFSRFSGGTRDGVLTFDPQGRLVKANEYAPAALAARGIRFPLGNRTRIPALADPRADPEEIARAVPWIRPDWIERVKSKGEDLGTLVVVPLPGRPGASTRTAQTAKSTHPAGLSEPALRPMGFEGLLGDSPVHADTIEKARRLAKVAIPILLEGAAGVGKEALARSIHGASPMSGGPFIAVACGGLSRELLVTELFGYAEGSFSGTRRGGMAGKIEAADGGTLFIDEVDQMAPDLQSQFLRVLQEGEIYRLGEIRPRKVRFRLVAATSQDLGAEADRGRFRMDLLCRISVTSLRLPSLRDRSEDIPALAEHFCERYAAEHGVDPKPFAPGVMEVLSDYDWPGNVRELSNVVEQMLLISDGDTLIVDDVPSRVRAPRSTALAAADPGSEIPDVQSLEAAERQAIQRAVDAAGGNMTHAARHLGVAKSTLYLKLKKYGLDR